MSPVDDRRELLFPYHVLTITDYGVDLRKKKGIMLPQTRTTANALLDHPHAPDLIMYFDRMKLGFPEQRRLLLFT